MVDSLANKAKPDSGSEFDNNLLADVESYRAGICAAFLLTFAIAAIPSLFASLSRIADIGWQAVMGIHIAVVSALWLVVLFRKKIPYHLQAVTIVIMFMVIGVGGLLQFGLTAGGVAFLVASAPIATLLLGGGAGLVTLVAAFGSAAAISVLTVSGHIVHTLDLNSYALRPLTWVNSLVGWALASVALTISLWVLHRQMISTLKSSRKNEQALQLTEERLQMVLEGSEQGFWDWDIETDHVSRNDRWAKMLGYESIEEFDSTTDAWTQSIHQEDREAAWKSIDDHLQGLTPAHNIEYRMVTKTGEQKWFLDHARVVARDALGKPLRMSGTHTDITQRKKLEQERVESIQKLEAALKEVKILRGIIPICSYCHSIRNDEGAWARLETYISENSDAEFSHGICPKCADKVRAEFGIDDEPDKH